MPEPSGSSNPHRLPRTVVPSRYDLVLEPDLEAGTFSGVVDITLEVTEPLDALVLNAAELTIDSATIAYVDGTASDLETALDATAERLTCTPLAGPAPAGPATLTLAFRGVLNEKLRGFYRSRFVDAQGVERTLATTQFESTDARRAFPCWDEPDRKAVFGVTLVVPDDLTAISNGAEASREALEDGRVRVRFTDTMPMSTYLVAFVVGPLEATRTVDVDGVPLRVVHPLGKAPLANFALEIGASALRTFTDYYGIPYPGGKVDLVAIPDFAFGAMENLGCITFRETALLVDPSTATQPELERVADVVAHELAHMWFGDLVTMRWWNGIWLNEAFATFMEVLAVDRFRPAWSRWSTFALGRSAAFDTDALASTRPIEYPVLSPAEAEGMFDILTYEKGASVVRMLEQYLGEDTFRRGIADYLGTHAYGNTETTDLWDALEHASGAPVRRVADSWIFQGGHPLVSIARGDHPSTLVLDQRRFRYLDDDDGPRWSVPVGIRWADASGATHDLDVLLEDASTTVDLTAEPTWVVVNRSAAGFFRTDYSPDLRAALASVALEVLDPTERYALIDDTWAAVLAGRTPLEEAVELVTALAPDDDLSVWRRLLAVLALVHRVAAEADRELVSGFVRGVVGPVMDRLGGEPRLDEPERLTNLRAAAFEALGLFGDDRDVIARATYLVDRSMAGEAHDDPSLVDASVRVVAASADDATFDRFLAASQAAKTPQDRLRYLGALADVRDPSVFDRFLDLLLSDEVRTQDVALLLSRSLANRGNAGRAWDLVERRWDELLDRLPSNAISRMVTGVRTVTDPDLAARVEAFLDAHPVAQAAKAFSQHIERMQVTVSFAERDRSRLRAALAD